MQKRNEIVDIGKVSIYHFEQKQCTQIRSDKWYIKESKENRLIIKNREATAQVHLHDQVIIITYQSSKAYFSKMKSGYISIHFPIDDENMELFEYKLQENNIKLTDWNQTKETLQKEIKKQCGSNIDTEKNTKASSLQKVGYQVGKFFGNINSLIKSTPAERKSQQLTQKVEEIKEEKMSDDSKQRWKGFKSKVSSLNQKITETVKPASDKLSQTTSKMSEKFDKSENTIIKGIRNFGLKLKDSLNQGYSKHCNQVRKDEQKEPEKNIESQRGLK